MYAGNIFSFFQVQHEARILIITHLIYSYPGLNTRKARKG